MKLALAALLALGTSAFAQIPAKDRMVVVISLDGFPAYALDDPKLPIPTLRRLMQNGVSARMTGINPTVTWPNHTAMVTGVRADQHGLLTNGTIVRTGAWPPVKVDPMMDKEKMVHSPPSMMPLRAPDSPPRRSIGSPSTTPLPSPGTSTSGPMPKARWNRR